MWTIYKHTNNITSESYIGYTSKTLEERSGINGENYLRTHGKDNRYMHPAFAQAILKYGKIKKIKENPEYYKELYNRMQAPRRMKVICNTTQEIYSSLTEAEERTGISRQCIAMCCRGELKTSGKLPDGTKLTWSFYKEGGEVDEQN